MSTPTPDNIAVTPVKENVPFYKDKKIIKKILPQTLMMFFILFNYTILRDTKDVLVVTAPKSGAEIIPFLKTYVQLPAAIGFTFIYSILSNKMSQARVFRLIITSFLAFFGSFAAFIYPNRGISLHVDIYTRTYLYACMNTCMCIYIYIFRSFTTFICPNRGMYIILYVNIHICICRHICIYIYICK
jgi:ATP/ADP translocase